MRVFTYFSWRINVIRVSVKMVKDRRGFKRLDRLEKAKSAKVRRWIG